MSYEDDFLSASLSASIERDFNQKNTTLSFGVNDENDLLHPIGGAPVPGSDYLLFEKSGHKSKNGVGALFGVTQVMNRRWIERLDPRISAIYLLLVLVIAVFILMPATAAQDEAARQLEIGVPAYLILGSAVQVSRAG